MVQRTSSTTYDPKYPWLTDYRFMGAEDPPNPDLNKPPEGDPTDPPKDPADPDPNKPVVTTDPAELAAENERIRQRMIAADKRASEAEKALRAVQDKDKSALELAQREAREAKEAKEAADAELKNQRIHNAFLSDNTYDWHSNSSALKLLDLENVTIDDAGKVSGLPAALKKLATEHPYLLKSKDNGGGGGGGGGGGQPTGDGKDGKNGKDGKGPDVAKLEKTFPALVTRR